MPHVFADEVSSSAWRAEVEAWIGDRLTQIAPTTITSLTQTRLRPWSTQLVVETSAGRFWFKALPDGVRHEAALLATLAELVPDHVARPVAVQPERGWILDRDHGPTWREERPSTTADWQSLMVGVARLQQQVARHADTVLATGLPVCGPDHTLDLFDRFVAIFAELDPAHPCHLDAGTVAALADRRPALKAAAERLQASDLPVTLQHGDVHTGNVFVSDGHLRLFDFGDAQWAHALEVLAVPRGVIDAETDGTVHWEPVLAAYCDAWDLEPAQVSGDLSAAWLTQPVHRCLTWWRALAGASAAQWHEWGDAPVHHLTRVLADG